MKKDFKNTLNNKVIKKLYNKQNQINNHLRRAANYINQK